MTTGERLRNRRKELELSAEKVAEAIGVSPATIYRYENGGIEKLPGDILFTLAEILRTTPAVLMGWEDAAQSAPTFDVFSLPGVMPPPKTVKKPRLGTIACGKPILAAENIDEYDDVPEEIQCDFTLKCKGDSMINARIFDGDIVYIRCQPEVENGEIAAVRIGNEATLKKVYTYPNRVELRAENPTMKPMEFENEQLTDIAVLGKVVAFMSFVK